MEQVLKDKVAVVTGAASGVGAATAKLFAEAGAKVVLADYNEEGAIAVADEINEAHGAVSLALKVDVSKAADTDAMIEKAIEEFGGFDILINNAGIMDSFEPVGEITDERWEQIFAVNVMGVMRAMRKAVNYFKEHGGGTIVNTASVGGIRGARAGAAYTASKHALIGLTKNTGYMYANDGIRVNAVAPGGVDTNIGDSMEEVSEFGYGRMMAGEKTNPRMGQSEEIAEVMLFLASDRSSFVNGSVVTADSGFTAY